MRMNSDQLRLALAQCTGTSTWYRHPLNRKITYTDGVKLFADEAGEDGAYWLLDIIITEVARLKSEFINIVLTVANNAAQLVADDGNGNVLWQRRIDYTDCQDGEWKFYLTNDVILLPSEW